MKQKRNQKLRLVLSLSVFAVVVLAVFYRLNGRPGNDGSDGEKGSTEVQAILSKDLERNYPASVREVVRLYSRILKCWYQETISEEQWDQLLEMQRMLYDEELLQSNPLETQKTALKAELEQAKENKQVMASYRLQKESSVKKWKSEGESYGSILACYMMHGKNGYEYTYEEFLLREDANGHWKIVGWRLTDATEIED